MTEIAAENKSAIYSGMEILRKDGDVWIVALGNAKVVLMVRKFPREYQTNHELMDREEVEAWARKNKK